MYSHSSFLRLKDVMKRTGLGRSTIYELMGAGKFPKQIHLTERAIGWVEDEVHDWIVQRLEAAGRVPKRI